MIKTRCEDLAIFGGSPAFGEPLHVGRPNIGDRAAFMARMNSILDRRWLTNSGPFVQEFERRIAELVGVRHCIAVCNATVALEITARALDLRGEVIVPSFTFIATAHALKWQEITPVFCDVDPVTHNIDPDQISALITPRTSAILGVHVWGRACEVGALQTLAQRHGLKLLFDAAHAFGSSHHGRSIGSFGDAEVFSFHATKFVNSFEGGAITTDNDDLAARIRRMKNFGFVGYDAVEDLGTNGKMPEASAAMGLTSLDGMAGFVDANRSHYERYLGHLKDIPGISVALHDRTERSNHQYVVIEVNDDEAGLGRDDVMATLWGENVLARRYFYPGCHRMEPYRTLDPHACRHLPHTERLTRRVLVLPNGPTLEGADVDNVCNVIQLAVQHGPAVRERLQHRDSGALPQTAATST